MKKMDNNDKKFLDKIISNISGSYGGIPMDDDFGDSWNFSPKRYGIICSSG